MAKVELRRDNIDPNAAYSVPEVARVVGWTPRWLRQLVAERRIHGFRPNGHQWRIPGVEVQRILSELAYDGRVRAAPPKLLQNDNK